MTKLSKLSQLLIDRGTHELAPDGNGVILKIERPKPVLPWGNLDKDGFPLHAGNPVWMD